MRFLALRLFRLLFCSSANHTLERFFVHIRAKATRSLYELRVLVLSFLLRFTRPTLWAQVARDTSIVHDACSALVHGVGDFRFLFGDGIDTEHL
jgi:hypothetical protein